LLTVDEELSPNIDDSERRNTNAIETPLIVDIILEVAPIVCRTDIPSEIISGDTLSNSYVWQAMPVTIELSDAICNVAPEPRVHWGRVATRLKT
jgi:hypothetical protein